MAALSTALHGNYIPEIWSKTMESLFYPQLFLAWITNNKREGEIKNFGGGLEDAGNGWHRDSQTDPETDR